MAIALAILLIVAAVCDIRAHRIPNVLSVFGLALGLLRHGCRSGGPGLLWSSEGIVVACLALLPYALGALGAGDVKLLGAVGALMGPVFLLWTLLGTIFFGAFLAIIWAMTRGVLRETLINAAFGLHLLGARAGVAALASTSKAGRMPLAPAIALGALWAFWHLYGQVMP
jgi:prepilin peptidase CpaA